MPPSPQGPGATAPVRVLVVTVVHDPEDARIRHRQIPALLSAGHQVTYAAPFVAYGRTAPAGVEGIDLPRASGRRRLGAVRAARRLVARLAPDHDVVLLHDPDLLLAVVGLRAVRRTAVVWDVHEDTAAAVTMRAWVPTPLRRVAAAGVRAAERWAERRLHLTLAEHDYRHRFRREHPVVPNSVVVPPADPPPPGDDRVVYVGRVTVERGGRILLTLPSHLPSGVTLDVIGPADAELTGPLRSAETAGRLRWRGFLPNDEALAAVDGALAGLSLLRDQPNYARSRPTKVMEYMAHGVPVITTPNPASQELVEAAGSGLVVPFDDVEAVGRVIAELQADGERRRALGAAGRTTAVAELDWSRDAVTFVAALEDWGRHKA